MHFNISTTVWSFCCILVAFGSMDADSNKVSQVCRCVDDTLHCSLRSIKISFPFLAYSVDCFELNLRENSSASVLMLTACLEISGIFKINFPLKTKPHGCLETQETGLVPAAECVSTPRMPRDTRKKSEINTVSTEINSKYSLHHSPDQQVPSI